MTVMKCYEVQSFNTKTETYYSYVEFALSSKEAKEKAKLKTINKIISAREIK